MTLRLLSEDAINPFAFKICSIIDDRLQFPLFVLVLWLVKGEISVAL